MYDYELLYDYTDADAIKHYYYEIKNRTYPIESNYFDLYEKVVDDYYSIGHSNIEVGTVYWVKQYDIDINLTTEKVVEYDNIAPMNSYHIGNGVVAELTF